MTRTGSSPRELAEQLLASIDRAAWRVTGSAANFTVSVVGIDIVFDAKSTVFGHAFERLAFAVEARIASERASAMLAAVPNAGPLPLWLISGSDVLARWLTWSGSANALRKTLRLTDALGRAPVSGDLARRARRELGQAAAKIRVRQGIAVAEEIELAEHPATTLILGETARVRVAASALPETLLTALRQDCRQNALRNLAEVVDHPFIAAADLKMTSVRNDGTAVVFELASHQAPLAPVPAEAWAVLPRAADPILPWWPTASERREHDGLVEAGR